MYSILFVCTGNTCRSPMAEACGRRLFQEFEDRVTVASAGLSAFAGALASTGALRTVHGQGGDLGGHRSQPLTADNLAAADLVLTMTSAHREEILRRFPEVSAEVLTLAEFSGAGGGDVLDPIGGSFQQYEATYRQIEHHLEASLPRIARRAGDVGDEDSVSVGP